MRVTAAIEGLEREWDWGAGCESPKESIKPYILKRSIPQEHSPCLFPPTQNFVPSLFSHSLCLYISIRISDFMCLARAPIS